MKVAVIGLGRLGGPLAILAASRGHDVLAIDRDRWQVDKILHGRSPVDETGLGALMKDMMGKPGIRLRAGTTMYRVAETEISFVVVPTPSNNDGTFTAAYVVDAVRSIGEALAASKPRTPRHTVVVVSTLTPGSMEGPVRGVLEKAAGQSVGPELGLVYAPQLIALGSVLADLQRPDVVLLGASDSAAWGSAAAFFGSLHNGPDPTFTRMSLEEAEVAKIAINAYVTMKMSFANVLGEIAASRGLRPEVIAQAVGTDTRIGRKYLKPATAYGGVCFPRDSRAFAAYARSVGASPELADATDVVNERQHVRIVQWVWGRLEEMSHRGTVGILGLTYKPGTSVTEASAGMAVAERLVELGVPVLVHDPAAVVLPAHVNRVESAQDVVDRSAIVVITTPWPEYAQLKIGEKPVLDPWGILAKR